MKITIEIQEGNEAFRDPCTDECDIGTVVINLHEAVRQIGQRYPDEREGRMCDSNGNTAIAWKVED